MKQSINSWIKIFFSSMSFVSMLFFITRYAAADINNIPTFEDARSILVRIINILIISAGAVLVGMIAYGVWKSSLATGDPRSLEGAKSTWTYALFGFFIVVGAFAIIMIVEGIIGVSSGASGGLVGKIIDSLNELLNIQSTPPPTP
jgi:small-conductance mechanosensitive channel